MKMKLSHCQNHSAFPVLIVCSLSSYSFESAVLGKGISRDGGVIGGIDNGGGGGAGRGHGQKR